MPLLPTITTLEFSEVVFCITDIPGVLMTEVSEGSDGNDGRDGKDDDARDGNEGRDGNDEDDRDGNDGRDGSDGSLACRFCRLFSCGVSRLSDGDA